MPRYPAAIERLISEFKRLPGVGEKTAERYVFSILRRGKDACVSLAESLLALERGIRTCSSCRAASESDPCAICRNPQRQSGELCVVADHQGLAAMERTGEFRGRYFVLGGLLSPIDGITPETLGIEDLDTRINSGVTELILAINPTIEGEATISWISRRYATTVPKVTRLARGLARGSDIEFADEVTLSDAYRGRRETQK
jgi:recombination protein RecR